MNRRTIRRLFAGAVAAAAVAVTLGVVHEASAQAIQYGEISWTINGKRRCLEVDPALARTNNAPLQVWDCWGGDNQKWAVLGGTEGSSIESPTGMCVGLPKTGVRYDGKEYSRIVQTTCEIEFGNTIVFPGEARQSHQIWGFDGPNRPLLSYTHSAVAVRSDQFKLTIENERATNGTGLILRRALENVEQTPMGPVLGLARQKLTSYPGEQGSPWCPACR